MTRLLARISAFDPLAGDLAWELLDTLTKVPLPLHGPDTTSKVVHIIASELAYSKCTSQHAWLGLDLLRIVKTEMRTRPLTDKEMSVIRDMAIRRQAQWVQSFYSCWFQITDPSFQTPD